MSTALTILIIALKVIGILLLILLAVLLVILSLPMGAWVRYQAGELCADVCVGPFKKRVYPLPAKAQDAAPAKPKKQKPAKAKKEKKAAPPPAPAEKAGTTPPAVKAAAPASSSDAGGGQTAAGQLPAPETPPAKPAPNRRVQALLNHLKEDPLGFLEAMLAHAAFAGGRFIRGIHIHHLTVYWTVTAADKDAAQTAIQYGQQITLLNNLLVRARQHMDIRAESLRLEPDFTGDLAQNRTLACQITLRPIIIVVLAVRLLFRLLFEPNLKGVLL